MADCSPLTTEEFALNGMLCLQRSFYTFILPGTLQYQNSFTPSTCISEEHNKKTTFLGSNPLVSLHRHIMIKCDMFT